MEGERQMKTRWAIILLTPEEMDEIDDGQEWYKPGDTVCLSGWIDADTHDGTLDLAVAVNDGTTHDNWTTMADLPPHIRQRLIDSP
jgi:hypothetical protein